MTAILSIPRLLVEFMVQEAGLIHDCEVDDVVFAAMMRMLGYTLIPVRVCVGYKDDTENDILGKKTKMWDRVVGVPHGDDVWVRKKKLQKISLPVIRKFAEKLSTKFSDRDYIPLFVTAPTYGILSVIYEVCKKPLIVSAYTGTYNLANMDDLKQLYREGKAFVIDTSVQVAMGYTRENNEPRQIRNLTWAFESSNFWDVLKRRQPKKFNAIVNFIVPFNRNLMHPLALIEPECQKSVDIQALTRMFFDNFDEYVKYIKRHDLAKSKKKNMVEHPELTTRSGPICDVFIAFLTTMVHKDPNTIEFVEGKWVHTYKSKVEKADEKTAVGWRFKHPHRVAEHLRDLYVKMLLGKHAKEVKYPGVVGK